MPKSRNLSPHDEAVSIIEKLASANLGSRLEAAADCNQCTERLSVNLVEGASRVIRERFVGAVCPDICLLDKNGNAVRFIEVVDSHAPVRNVHEYALENGIEILEIHLRAKRGFVGRRMNKALDMSLTVKARLQELSKGRIVVDAHNLLCRRPKCRECGDPLPLRTITVSITDCWKCGQNVNVATGEIDGKILEQDYFAEGEIEFARENGVTLERRFSATAGGKYLANVCTECDQIQGNWFLYMDPLHDRFNLKKTERKTHGPCDRCSTYHCWTHGEYLDYKGGGQCPSCLVEAERVMCSHNIDRECFYPRRCAKDGCYFLNREQLNLEQQDQARQQERLARERREQEQLEQQMRCEQDRKEWEEFQQWVERRRE